MSVRYKVIEETAPMAATKPQRLKALCDQLRAAEWAEDEIDDLLTRHGWVDQAADLAQYKARTTTVGPAAREVAQVEALCDELIDRVWNTYVVKGYPPTLGLAIGYRTGLKAAPADEIDQALQELRQAAVDRASTDPDTAIAAYIRQCAAALSPHGPMETAALPATTKASPWLVAFGADQVERNNR